EFNFPSEFPYEFDSAPDSACADDDNDFFAGLTRRLTQQISLNPQKKRMVARSPESTLSGLGSMSVSSNGNPFLPSSLSLSLSLSLFITKLFCTTFLSIFLLLLFL
ncbi:hypothetical protein LINPERPRIM_LOCUS37952, partial [Linum perenne]